MADEEDDDGEDEGETYIAVITEEAEIDATADTFQCGTCGAAFHDLGLFLAHKNGCKVGGSTDNKGLEVEVTEVTEVTEAAGETEGAAADEDAVEEVNEIIVPDVVLEAVARKEKRITKRLARRPMPAPQLLHATKSGPLKECHVCRKSFRRPSDLVVHLRSHSGEKPFQCVVCGKSFNQKSNVRTHIERHKTWPKTFRKLELQPATVEGVASVKKYYACGLCDHKYESKALLSRHQNENHSDEKRFRCPREGCDELFAAISDLTSHLSSSHSNGAGSDGNYKCDKCGAPFDDLAALKIHQTGHEIRRDGRPPRPHPCPQPDCRGVFSSAKNLDLHLASGAHENACLVCDRIFENAAKFRLHVESHRARRFACGTCGKEFASHGNLRNHLRIHTGETPFACLTCGRRFNRADKLARHAKSHDAAARVGCPFREAEGCAMSFYRDDKLKEHVACMHTSSKRFSCRYCEAEFSKPVDLRAHQKRAHPLAYPCMFCQQVFKQEKSLQSHLRGCVASAKRVIDVVGGEEIQVINVDGDDEDKEEEEAV